MFKVTAIAMLLACSSAHAGTSQSVGRLKATESRASYEKYGESNADYSKWDVYASDIPVEEVSVKIHCKSTVKLSTTVENGEWTEVIRCAGKGN